MHRRIANNMSVKYNRPNLRQKVIDDEEKVDDRQMIEDRKYK